MADELKNETWTNAMFKSIERHSVLWDDADIDRSSRLAQDQAWEYVKDEIFQKTGIPVKGELIKARWKKLREAWKKQSNKEPGQATRNSKNAKYFRQMAFLHKTLKKKTPPTKKAKKPKVIAGQQSSESSGCSMPPIDFAGHLLPWEQIPTRRQQFMEKWSNLELLQKELEKERDEKRSKRSDASTDREKLNIACQVSRINKGKLTEVFREKLIVELNLKALSFMEQYLAIDWENQQLKHENDQLRGQQSAGQFTIGEKRHQLDQELHQLGVELASLYEKSGEIDAQFFMADDAEKLTADRELISCKIETINARIEAKQLEMKVDNIEGIAAGLQIENCNLREQLQAANGPQPIGSTPPPVSPSAKGLVIRRVSLGQVGDGNFEVFTVGSAQPPPNVNSALGTEISVPFTTGQFETM